MDSSNILCRVVYSVFKGLIMKHAAVFTLGIHTDRSEQVMQSTASDQGIQHLPLIKQFLDTTTGSKMDC